MTKNNANPYEAREILTASPTRLVVKLYEQAIASLRQAVKAIENNDVNRRWRANKRAMDVIEYLCQTLNMEKGGEISANLERLYHFMLRRLLDVDLRNDPQPAKEVIGLLEPLYQSWSQLDQELMAKASAAKPRSEAKATSPDPIPTAVGNEAVTAPPVGPIIATI